MRSPWAFAAAMMGIVLLLGGIFIVPGVAMGIFHATWWLATLVLLMLYAGIAVGA